jgi:hypothetical protein
MDYPIIQPPFTLKFREMSKKELSRYREWFCEVIPERVQVLAEAVKSTPGYRQWEPDCSPDSLPTLGDWFLGQVETRSRTQEEIDSALGQLRISIPVSEEELTNRTFSLAMDIGMYVSQVFLKNHSSLEWAQPMGNKKLVDYGPPVLSGFEKVVFNPVQAMVTLAYGFSRQTRTGDRLRELYDYWAKLVPVGKA